MLGKKIPYADPYVTEEDVEAVAEAVRSKRLSQGEIAARFEQEFAKHINLKHGVAATNGTAALHLGVSAAGIKPGDEVVIPSFTFAATANCVLYVGGKPVFVDIGPNTFNINPKSVEKAVPAKTKGIIVVHFGGQMADMDPIMETAEKHGLLVIEDATEAHGATYKNRQAGSIAKMGCFSFYPNKNMTTGEGGMLVTNDDDIASKARLLRAQGQIARFQHVAIGFNYKMSDILAALGLSQLKRLEWVIQKKIEAARVYEELLSGVEGVQTPFVMPSASHTYMFYTLKFRDGGMRDKVMAHLSKNGVETVVAFPPLHLQAIYQSLCKYEEDELGVTEDCSKRVLSLPIYPHILRQDQEFIAKLIMEEMKK